MGKQLRLLVQELALQPSVAGRGLHDKRSSTRREALDAAKDKDCRFPKPIKQSPVAKRKNNKHGGLLDDSLSNRPQYGNSAATHLCC